MLDAAGLVIYDMEYKKNTFDVIYSLYRHYHNIRFTSLSPW